MKKSGNLAVIWKNPDSFEIIRKIGNHLENPDSFEIIRKLAVIRKNLDSFEVIQKVGNHLENPDSFEIIWKIGSHLENRDSFEIIRKIGSHLEKNPDSFETIRKIGKIRIVLKVLTQFKRFFRLYAQKLSGRAKTFRVAMLPCYPGFSASAQSAHFRTQKNGTSSG